MKYKDTQNKVHDISDGSQHLMDGWPNGYTEITEAAAVALLAPPPLTIPEQIQAIDDAIEAHAEAVAKARIYRSADRCISYAGYPNPYQAECLAFATWRTGCFTYAIAEMGKVIAGDRTMPTKEEAIAELPPMVWPV